MSSPKRAFFALPYARRELPGWGRLLRMLGVWDHSLWTDAAVREVRGKWHGYTMSLDLSVWPERLAFFVGRFNSLSVELLIRNILVKGDHFIDVGANIGLATLTAAKAVGRTGHVWSFEPNPLIVKRLRDVVAINRIEHVTVFPCGLADRNQTTVLSIAGPDSGYGTCAAPGDNSLPVTAQYDVEIRIGDEMLPDVRGPLTIKFDAEGYEYHALKGLCGVVQRLQPAIITPLQPEYLERAGASAEQFWEMMTGQHYTCYCVNTARTSLRLGDELVLWPAESLAEATTSNILWLPSAGPHRDRLDRWIENQARRVTAKQH